MSVGLIFSKDPTSSKVFENSSYITTQEADYFGRTHKGIINYGGIKSYVVDVSPGYVELIDSLYPSIINKTCPTQGKEFKEMIVQYFSVASANYNYTPDVCHRIDLEIIDFILENITKDNISLVNQEQLGSITSHIDGEIIHEERFIFMKICCCKDPVTINTLIDKYVSIDQRHNDDDEIWSDLYSEAVIFAFEKFGKSPYLLEWLENNDKLVFNYVQKHI